MTMKRRVAFVLSLCLLIALLAGPLTACGRMAAPPSIRPALTTGTSDAAAAPTPYAAPGTPAASGRGPPVSSATAAAGASLATTATGASGPSVSTAGTVSTTAAAPANSMMRADGRYSAPADVALYLRTYGRLPRNYLTKSEAMRLGWNANQGNLWDVTDRMSIGGDIFGNREGLLPAMAGRVWRECDVNYQGGYRGGERIVYSNDGLIYYSKDHYASFIRLY